jgi:hypothetical protein
VSIASNAIIACPQFSKQAESPGWTPRRPITYQSTARDVLRKVPNLPGFRLSREPASDPFPRQTFRHPAEGNRFHH